MAEEAGTDTDGAATPSEPAPKKRGRGNADNDEEVPAKKKAKNGSKKASKTKVKDDVESLGNSATSEVETLTKISKAKKTSTGHKKKSFIEDDEEEATIPNGQANGKSRSRKRGPPRKAKTQAEVAERESDAEGVDSASEAADEPVKAGKARKTKNAK